MTCRSRSERSKELRRGVFIHTAAESLPFAKHVCVAVLVDWLPVRPQQALRNADAGVYAHSGRGRHTEMRDERAESLFGMSRRLLPICEVRRNPERKHVLEGIGLSLRRSPAGPARNRRYQNLLPDACRSARQCFVSFGFVFGRVYRLVTRNL